MAYEKQPVTINGTTYPSHTAAGRALGLSTQAISVAKKRGKLHTLGKGTRRKVMIDGVLYPSISEAARSLKMPYGTFRHKFILNMELTDDTYHFKGEKL